MTEGQRRSDRVRKQTTTLANKQAIVTELTRPVQPAIKKRKVKIDPDAEITLTMATTAAARTFGIAELLEQVLIRLAHIELADSMDAEVMYAEEMGAEESDTDGTQTGEGDAGIMKTDLPVIALFVLQRVNTTFHFVISGSQTLRRFMWLENGINKNIDTDPETFDLSRNFDALWRLLTNLEGNAFDGPDWKADGNFQTFYLDLAIPHESDHSCWREKTYGPLASDGTADASWKKIKIGHFANVTNTAMLSFNVHTRQTNQDVPNHGHTYSILLDPHRTLGDVFDLFERLMSRSLRDLRILSHLYAKHRATFNLGKTIMLESGASVAADGALVRYKEAVNAERTRKKKERKRCTVEKWTVINSAGEYGGTHAALDRCPLCHV